MISEDAKVLLLLCSHLGLGNDSKLDPLRLGEWNQIADVLKSKDFRPSVLLTWSEGDLQNELSPLWGDAQGDLQKDSFALEKLLNRPAGKRRTRQDAPQKASVLSAKRLADLLARGNQLAIELERLESLGIYSLTRADGDYPQRYRQRLKKSAPPVLFYAGNKDLLEQQGVAVVGSRKLDQQGERFAEYIGQFCAQNGLVLYSGGAKGADTISMEAALQFGGKAVGVLVDSLERALRRYHKELRSGNLCLITPYKPDTGFSISKAMGRNQLIYCLADCAIVVASGAETGGTWAGAIEALKKKWVPVFVLQYPEMPEGNPLLLQKGALPLSPSLSELINWLQEAQPANQIEPLTAEQGKLPTAGEAELSPAKPGKQLELSIQSDPTSLANA